MTTETVPTPAQLRDAADKLARAIAVEGGVTEATNIVNEIYDDLPPGIVRDSIAMLPGWKDRHGSEDAWNWLAQAVRLRLLVEAALLEYPDPIETLPEVIRTWLKEVGR